MIGPAGIGSAGIVYVVVMIQAVYRPTQLQGSLHSNLPQAVVVVSQSTREVAGLMREIKDEASNKIS